MRSWQRGAWSYDVAIVYDDLSYDIAVGVFKSPPDWMNALDYE